MLRTEQSVTTRREFLVRSAATAAGTFLSIGLPVLGNGTAEADTMSGFTPSIWFLNAGTRWQSHDAHRQG